MKNAIVLTVDRLNAGFLGPYGNTWVETPGFNRLAAESALFEFALSDSTDLHTVCRSMWSGLHAMCGPRQVPGLAETAAAAGIHPVLITDQADVANHPLACGFRERVIVPAPAATDAPAELGKTQLARLLSTAIQWLQNASDGAQSRPDRSFLLWIHSLGMQGPWDAPFDFREMFADDEDPVPPDFIEPPVRQMLKNEDPDLVLGIQHAYAGQITVLDACLEAFLEACQTIPSDGAPLLLVASPRGYPLGEHGRIGDVDQVLYGEHLHVPCLIRYPDGADAMVRSHQLVQPSDWYATLLDWFELTRPCGSNWGQSLAKLVQGAVLSDRVCAVSDSCRALRTPTWFLQCRGDAGRELYAKPDDRWEANEVSDRCRDVLPELVSLLDEFQQAAGSDAFPQFSEIPPFIASSDR
jgi:hypothetical protein